MEEKKIKFRVTALICKILKCERISEVKSATFQHPLVSIVVVVLFQSQRSLRFGRFVLLFQVLVHAEIINDITTN